MSEHEMNKNMEFIIEQQAKFAADIEIGDGDYRSDEMNPLCLVAVWVTRLGGFLE